MLILIFLAGDRKDNALTDRQLKVGMLEIQDIWASLAMGGPAHMRGSRKEKDIWPEGGSHGWR